MSLISEKHIRKIIFKLLLEAAPTIHFLGRNKRRMGAGGNNDKNTIPVFDNSLVADKINLIKAVDFPTDSCYAIMVHSGNMVYSSFNPIGKEDENSNIVEVIKALIKYGYVKELPDIKVVAAGASNAGHMKINIPMSSRAVQHYNQHRTKFSYTINNINKELQALPVKSSIVIDKYAENEFSIFSNASEEYSVGNTAWVLIDNNKMLTVMFVKMKNASDLSKAPIKMTKAEYFISNFEKFKESIVNGKVDNNKLASYRNANGNCGDWAKQ